LHLLRELVHLLALAPDHEPGPRGADPDRDAVALALDRDLGDARLVEALLEVALDQHVLAQHLRIRALAEPARVPGLDDSEPQSDGVGLLSHALPTPSSPRSPTRGSCASRAAWPGPARAAASA